MHVQELKEYLSEWRKNRMLKMAPEVISEFQTHSERFESLHHMAITVDAYPFQEYASWLASHLIDLYRIEPTKNKIHEITDAILLSSNHTVKRNLLKTRLHFTSDYRVGELIDRAFQFLTSPQETIAVRVYSFYFLLQEIKKYPDLMHEMDVIVEHNSELFSAPALQVCLKRYHKNRLSLVHNK